MLMPLMLRSFARLVSGLVINPAPTVTTILFYSDLLPHHLNLERLVRPELLDQDNYIFHFLVNILRCLWYVYNIPGSIVARFEVDASFVEEVFANLRVFTFFSV